MVASAVVVESRGSGEPQRWLCLPVGDGTGDSRAESFVPYRTYQRPAGAAQFICRESGTLKFGRTLIGDLQAPRRSRLVVPARDIPYSAPACRRSTAAASSGGCRADGRRSPTSRVLVRVGGVDASADAEMLQCPGSSSRTFTDMLLVRSAVPFFLRIAAGAAARQCSNKFKAAGDGCPRYAACSNGGEDGRSQAGLKEGSGRSCRG